MGIHSDDRTVKLRSSLEQLYCLWKQRIEDRRPFQYVVGCEHWRDLVLSVQDGVLIPRPETEVFVDSVGDLVTKNADLREGLWADLGTGSGAIAIGIGRILGPGGKVIATDLSPVSVAVASFNVQRYSLQVCDLKSYPIDLIFCLNLHYKYIDVQTHVYLSLYIYARGSCQCWVLIRALFTLSFLESFKNYNIEYK